MAINSNNVQNVRFLRNGTLFTTRDEAKNALTRYTLTSEMDGSVILARYTDSEANTTKTLMGLVYFASESNKSITIFDIDDAGTDAKAYVDSLVGGGVTSANTVTDQLEALSGSTADTSATTSVAGAKKYTDDKIDALDVDTVAVEGKPIIAVKQENGLVSASAGTINAEFVNYAGTTAHTATTVEDAIDYLYETIDNFEDFKDRAVEGQYVSEVSFADGRPQISRVALPSAVTVADDNKIVSDVTQTNGKITATAKNLTSVKLGEYAEGTDADIAATDTLGQALGKLQAQINAMDLSAVGTEGSVITSVSEDDGKVSATTTPVKDVKLTGYVKDTAKTGDIAATDDIEDALSKLENKVGANKITNTDNSIIVTEPTGTATTTDIKVNIKSGEKVIKLGADGIYTNLNLVKITTGLGETIKESYEFRDSDGNKIGESIDIAKDSHIVSITYDETTQKLIYKYLDASGVEQTTEVDMAHLILETEVENGIQSVNGKLSIKLDTTGDDTGDGKFLTVGANGLKLDGVTDAISTAISNLDFTADTAVAGQYVAAIEETDGVVAVKTRANVSEAVLNNYTKGSDATAVAATDTVNQAISKLENQVDAADGLVDALSAKTFTVATSSNASITTATAETADGTVSVDLITDADKIKMSGFTSTGASLSAITTDDSIATAFEKTEAAIDDAKSASTTEVVEGTDAGNNMTIASATSQTDGHVTYTINLTDVASDSALTAEITARKAVDGQSGSAYTANSSANYISDATSLNDADVKLDAALKALSDGTVNEVQVNGVTLAETNNAVNVQISSAPASGTIASPIVVKTDESTGAVTLQILQIDCGEY